MDDLKRTIETLGSENDELTVKIDYLLDIAEKYRDLVGHLYGLVTVSDDKCGKCAFYDLIKKRTAAEFDYVSQAIKRGWKINNEFESKELKPEASSKPIQGVKVTILDTGKATPEEKGMLANIIRLIKSQAAQADPSPCPHVPASPCPDLEEVAADDEAPSPASP